MFEHLGPALRRALAATRSSNPVEATRILQEALNRRTDHDGGSSRANRSTDSSVGRRGLAETLTALKEGAEISQFHRHPPPAELPGSAFLRRDIKTASGQRTYRLFVPSRSRPRGLVVMLHGCKQNAEDFAVGTTMNRVAEAEGMLVAYPTQSRSANPSGCWNWFRPEDQERGRGEPHIIAELTRAIAAEFGLPGNLFVAGLSAGGAMAAVMGGAYPDLYQAIGIHSGIPCGLARDLNTAFAAMRGAAGSSTAAPMRGRRAPRQIIFHGTRDHTVAPTNAVKLMDEVRRTHPSAAVSDRVISSGEMKVNLTVLAQAEGPTIAESWLVHGAGHHWIGGDPAGSFANRGGPNAAREMMRFFLGGQPQA